MDTTTIPLEGPGKDSSPTANHNRTVCGLDVLNPEPTFTDSTLFCYEEYPW